jgi:hypothetical protein
VFKCPTDVLNAEHQIIIPSQKLSQPPKNDKPPQKQAKPKETLNIYNVQMSMHYKCRIQKQHKELLSMESNPKSMS